MTTHRGADIYTCSTFASAALATPKPDAITVSKSSAPGGGPSVLPCTARSHMIPASSVSRVDDAIEQARGQRVLMERRGGGGPDPLKERRKSSCALCGERVDLREEHYRMVSQFRAHRAVVHVDCYSKLKRERPK